MKKGHIILGCGIVLALGVVFAAGGSRILAKSNLDILKSSAVIAVTNKNTVLYNNIEDKPIYNIPYNENVEILKDRGEKWYYILYKNKKGWIKGEDIDIPKDRQTNTSMLSDSFITEYANENLKSDTRHFVWVDIDRQRIYILIKNNEGWDIEKRIVCATGKNTSPTVRGSFKIGDRGQWFYSERLGSGAMYWVRFNDSYLFHTVAMDKNKNITDYTLGTRHSSGCIRMSVEDAKWFYDNIEEGTAVWTY